MQLVDTHDNHIAGRFEFFLLTADGKISSNGTPLTGTRDGEMIVITIKSSPISDDITASGTCTNDVLHLSGSFGGASFQWNFNKSDEAVFRSEVATFTSKGAEIISSRLREENELARAKQRKELITSAKETARIMDAFTARASGGPQYFKAVEQRYHAITGNMQNAFSQARSIYGDGQAAVARSQIYVAINQASIEAEQFHMNVASAAQGVEDDVRAALTEYSTLTANCRALT